MKLAESGSGQVPGLGFADLYLPGLELLQEFLSGQVEVDMDLISLFDGDLLDDPGKDHLFCFHVCGVELFSPGGDPAEMLVHHKQKSDMLFHELGTDTTYCLPHVS